MSQKAEMAISTIPDVKIAKKQWKAYEQLCGKDGILDESDYQKITVKEKDEKGNWVLVEREFKKKSAWQKLSRAFNVDTSIMEKEFLRSNTGRIREAYYCIRATLPNGRSVESDALCSRSEKGKDKVSDHTIIATAKTRATNRAISELIGAGEVSSDEMTGRYLEDDEPKQLQDTTPQKEIVTKAKSEHEFDTADKINDPDPEDILRSQAMSIKDMLEQEGIGVTKHAMKLKVVKLVKSGDLPASHKHRLLAYITKHCPEEILDD